MDKEIAKLPAGTAITEQLVDKLMSQYYRNIAINPNTHNFRMASVGDNGDIEIKHLDDNEVYNNPKQDKE